MAGLSLDASDLTRAVQMGSVSVRRALGVDLVAEC